MLNNSLRSATGSAGTFMLILLTYMVGSSSVPEYERWIVIVALAAAQALVGVFVLSILAQQVRIDGLLVGIIYTLLMLPSVFGWILADAVTAIALGKYIFLHAVSLAAVGAMALGAISLYRAAFHARAVH